MATRTARAFVTRVFLALLCVVGCSQQRQVQGIAQSGASWSSGGADRVPGIDEGSVAFIMLKAGPPEGVPFVVWWDLPYNVSGSGGGSAQGASYEGRFSGAEGRRVEFRAQTADGRTGSVTIAGVDYDLGKGSLFLVSTRDHPPKVVQIPYDLSGFPRRRATALTLRRVPHTAPHSHASIRGGNPALVQQRICFCRILSAPAPQRRQTPGSTFAKPLSRL